MFMTVPVVVSLAALIVSVLAFFVAVLQFISTRDKIRIDLYERRIVVYSALKELLAFMHLRRDVDDKMFIDFLSKTAQAKFIFCCEVNDFILKRYVYFISEYQEIYRNYHSKNGLDDWWDNEECKEFFTKVHLIENDIEEIFSKYLVLSSIIVEKVEEKVVAVLKKIRLKF